jgi:hypothetical protein
MNHQNQPDVLDTLMTAVHLAATELAQVYPQDESLEKSVATWQKYLVQQAIKTQAAMTEGERFMYRLTHLLIPSSAKMQVVPCDTCAGTGECQGIAARESCGDGCSCKSLEDCLIGRECAACGGEGAVEVAQQ